MAIAELDSGTLLVRPETAGTSYFESASQCIARMIRDSGGAESKAFYQSVFQTSGRLLIAGEQQNLAGMDAYWKASHKLGFQVAAEVTLSARTIRASCIRCYCARAERIARMDVYRYDH